MADKNKQSQNVAPHNLVPFEEAILPVDSDDTSDNQEHEFPVFGQYMVTPKMLLGMLMWLGHMKRASDGLQSAILSIARTVVSKLPAQVALPNGLNIGKHVSVTQVKH